MSRRRNQLIALGLGGLLLLGAVVLVFTSVLPPRQSADVPLPSDSAKPDRVVAAYLAALDAHDCATAEALTIRGATPLARRWCADLSALTDVHLSSASSLSSGDGGEAAVVMFFDLDWRLFRGDDSVDEGTQTWRFDLTKGDAGGWRIFDQGPG